MRRDEFPIVEAYCKEKIILELENIKEEIHDYLVSNWLSGDIAAKETDIILDKHIKEIKQ